MAMHIWLHRSDRLCVCHHLLFKAEYSNYPFFTLVSGAQVGVASLAVNFLESQGVGIDAPNASQLVSLCQIMFTVGK